MKAKAIVANIKDNVATAIEDINADDIVVVKIGDEKREIKVNFNIPFGHKFSLVDIKLEDDVIKYGEVIGRATIDIKVGDHVHIHNVESKRGRGDKAKQGGTQ
jgi:altronate dehydratase small subunit